MNWLLRRLLALWVRFRARPEDAVARLHARTNPICYVLETRSAADLAIVPLDVPWPGEQGGPVTARKAGQEPLPLAFDHAEILGHAVKRLRGKLDYSRVAFALLPSLFTLRALQDVHEAILGTTFGKPAFRRRMLDKGWIVGTGARESGAAFRPAELYRPIPEVAQAR